MNHRPPETGTLYDLAQILAQPGLSHQGIPGGAATRRSFKRPATSRPRLKINRESWRAVCTIKLLEQRRHFKAAGLGRCLEVTSQALAKLIDHAFQLVPFARSNVHKGAADEAGAAGQ